MSGDDKFGLIAGLCGVLFLILVLVLDEAGVWSALASAVVKSPQATAFGGAVFTSVLVVVIGALLNAQLNRRRDDRLRRGEARALAAGLCGELKVAITTCAAQEKGDRQAAQRLDKAAHGGAKKDENITLVAFPFIAATIYEANAGNLGLLGGNLAGEIAWIYDRLLGYSRAAQATEEQNIATMPDYLRQIANVIKDLLPKISKCIILLEDFNPQ